MNQKPWHRPRVPQWSVLLTLRCCYSGPGADWGRDGGAVQQRRGGFSHGLGAALHWWQATWSHSTLSQHDAQEPHLLRRRSPRESYPLSLSLSHLYVGQYFRKFIHSRRSLPLSSKNESKSLSSTAGHQFSSSALLNGQVHFYLFKNKWDSWSYTVHWLSIVNLWVKVFCALQINSKKLMSKKHSLPPPPSFQQPPSHQRLSFDTIGSIYLWIVSVWIEQACDSLSLSVGFCPVSCGTS